jgi:hypothetical protein
MRCIKILLMPQPDFDFFINWPGARRCPKKSLPGAVHCMEHATLKERRAEQRRLKYQRPAQGMQLD